MQPLPPIPAGQESSTSTFIDGKSIILALAVGVLGAFGGYFISRQFNKLEVSAIQERLSQEQNKTEKASTEFRKRIGELSRQIEEEQGRASSATSAKAEVEEDLRKAKLQITEEQGRTESATKAKEGVDEELRKAKLQIEGLQKPKTEDTQLPKAVESSEVVNELRQELEQATGLNAEYLGSIAKLKSEIEVSKKSDDLNKLQQEENLLVCQAYDSVMEMIAQLKTVPPSPGPQLNGQAEKALTRSRLMEVYKKNFDLCVDQFLSEAGLSDETVTKTLQIALIIGLRILKEYSLSDQKEAMFVKLTTPETTEFDQFFMFPFFYNSMRVAYSLKTADTTDFYKPGMKNNLRILNNFYSKKAVEVITSEKINTDKRKSIFTLDEQGTFKARMDAGKFFVKVGKK